MHHIDKDRTGEDCPFCHKGKLQRSGYSSFEQNDHIQTGETGRSETRYECDNCGKETSGVGVGLKENVHMEESFSIGKPNTEDKEKL